MFTWLNKQGVQSDKGFIVQSVDRFTVEYQENNRCISIYVEDGFLPDGKFCEIIAPDVFSRWDDGTSISEEKQREILKNFIEAMEFQGIAVVID